MALFASDADGENHFLLHIFTRWKKDNSGSRIIRGGYPMLEFIAIKRRRDDE